jgi:hypothetical protein
MPATRRFLPLWIVEEHNNGCFIIVRDRDDGGVQV